MYAHRTRLSVRSRTVLTQGVSEGHKYAQRFKTALECFAEMRCTGSDKERKISDCRHRVAPNDYRPITLVRILERVG